MIAPNYDCAKLWLHQNYGFAKCDFCKLWFCQIMILPNYDFAKLWFCPTHFQARAGPIKLKWGSLAPFNQTVGSLLRTPSWQSWLKSGFDNEGKSAASFCCQVAISPIFYEPLFIWKFFVQLLCAYNLGW